MTTFEIAIRRLKSYRNTDRRAIFHNFSFEERLRPDRVEPYWRPFDPAPPRALKRLNHHHTRYLREQVFLPAGAGEIPETFAPDRNASALVPPPLKTRELVRVEMLDWILDKDARTRLLLHIDSLRLPPDTRPPEARAFFETLVNDWNRRRDQRPMFAAFADEVEDDIAAADWLYRLRARLGLGHIQPQPRRPIMAALLRYPVKEVLDATRKADHNACFAVPTVLDGPLTPYFYPAPPPASRHGRALDLEASPPGPRPATEVLHRRIDYRPAHLIKICEVRAPAPELHLAALRNAHLHRLRSEPDWDTFGEEMG